MKATFRLATLLLSLSVALAASAQDRPLRGGIGVSLSSLEIESFLVGGLPPAQIYFPIVVSALVRLEPQLGVLKLEDDQDPSQDLSIYTLGIGVLFTKHVDDEVLAYVGPRVAVSRVSQPVPDPFGPGSVDAVGTDLRLAGAVGGEYLLSPRFTLGAEAQVAFQMVGDRDVSAVGTIRGGSSVATTALVFFRAYLL